MEQSSAKVTCVTVECPHCQANSTEDASFFGEEKLAAFTDYKVECEACGEEFTFHLDVFG